MKCKKTVSMHTNAETRKAGVTMQFDDNNFNGNETVLVVDDQQDVVEILKLLLRERGYRVITACDGEEAVETFSRLHDIIDLVLMDVIMPRKDGVTASQEMCAIKPDARVIFMTGFEANWLNEIKGDKQVLMKPALSIDILCKVRQVLDTPGQAAHC